MEDTAQIDEEEDEEEEEEVGMFGLWGGDTLRERLENCLVFASFYNFLSISDLWDKNKKQREPKRK